LRISTDAAFSTALRARRFSRVVEEPDIRNGKNPSKVRSRIQTSTDRSITLLVDLLIASGLTDGHATGFDLCDYYKPDPQHQQRGTTADEKLRDQMEWIHGEFPG
jgi:hypothetical protein